MSVVDLDSAYYNIFIMKVFRRLFAIHWQGLVFFPIFMPFGIATGCITLQKVMDVIFEALFIVYPDLYTHGGRRLVGHYLDDAIMFAMSKTKSYYGTIIYVVIMHLTGLPVSAKKLQWPSKRCKALGFQYDLRIQILSLVEKKAYQYHSEVVWMIKFYFKITIKKCQGITGKLRYAATAIHGAQAFVRQIEEQFHALLSKGYNVNKFFILSKASLHNLLFWEQLLLNMNAIPFKYIDFDKNVIQIFLFTDASGAKDKGMGAWDTLGNNFSVPWSKTILKDHKIIHNNYNNELEFTAFAVAFLHYIDQYKKKAIGIFCDNKAAVGWFIKKAPSFSNRYHKCISYLIRRIAIRCIYNNIFVYIDYISTHENKRADGLSRMDFRALCYNQRGYTNPKFNKKSNPIKLLNSLLKKAKFL